MFLNDRGDKMETNKPEPQQPKEERFTISLTKEELIKEIRKLEENKNIRKFLEVQDGMEEFSKLQKFVSLLEEIEKRKEKQEEKVSTE